MMFPSNFIVLLVSLSAVAANAATKDDEATAYQQWLATKQGRTTTHGATQTVEWLKETDATTDEKGTRDLGLFDDYIPP